MLLSSDAPELAPVDKILAQPKDKITWFGDDYVMINQKGLIRMIKSKLKEIPLETIR